MEITLTALDQVMIFIAFPMALLVALMVALSAINR